MVKNISACYIFFDLSGITSMLFFSGQSSNLQDLFLSSSSPSSPSSPCHLHGAILSSILLVVYLSFPSWLSLFLSSSSPSSPLFLYHLRGVTLWSTFTIVIMVNFILLVIFVALFTLVSLPLAWGYIVVNLACGNLHHFAGRPVGRYYRPLVDNRPFCLNGRYS